MFCKKHDDDVVDRKWGSGKTECQQCLSVFQVMENIHDAMPEGCEDVTIVLDDCRDKIKLFMGHQIRCYIQERVIEAEYDYVLRQEEEKQPLFYWTAK